MININELLTSLKTIDEYFYSKHIKQIIILTGGSCAGKTTLIDCLEKAGFKCIREQAMIIIQRLIKWFADVELAKEWRKNNVFKFQMQIIAGQIINEQQNDYGLIFSDRGTIDSIAYLAFSKIIPTAQLVQLIKSKSSNYKKVFFAEQLPIFNLRADTGRIYNQAQAQEISELIESSYRNYNFEIVRLKALTINERLKFIAQSIIKDYAWVKSMYAHIADPRLGFFITEDQKHLIFLFGNQVAIKIAIAKIYSKLDENCIVLLRYKNNLTWLYEDDRKTAELIQALLAYGILVISTYIYRNNQKFSQPNFSAYNNIRYEAWLVKNKLKNSTIVTQYLSKNLADYNLTYEKFDYDSSISSFTDNAERTKAKFRNS